MVSPALISQTDLPASLARLIGATPPDGQAVDSVDVLDALLGKSMSGRQWIDRTPLGCGEKYCALRVNNWKWIQGATLNLRDDLSERTRPGGRQPDRAAAIARRLKELYHSSTTVTHDRHGISAAHRDPRIGFPIPGRRKAKRRH